MLTVNKRQISSKATGSATPQREAGIGQRFINLAKGRMLFCAVLSTLALSGCGTTERYYVRNDGSDGDLYNVQRAMASASAPARIDLGVTFKSDGKIPSAANNVLYRSVSDSLSLKGQWEVHRLGSAGDDFTPEIETAIHGAFAPVSQPAAVVPRMLVLVQDSPDLSVGARVGFFLSGMTFGLHRLQKPTDRYDVFVAYSDDAGVSHVYHSNKNMVLSTGNKHVHAAENQSADGLKVYDSSLAAFNDIVLNAVDGAQNSGVVTVGEPQLSSAAE